MRKEPPVTETANTTSPFTRSLEGLNQLVQILAIIGAGAWGGYTFIYQDQIKPLSGEPRLQVETQLAKLGVKGDVVAVQLAIKLHNAGAMRVRVMAMAYNIIGYRIAQKQQPSLLNLAIAKQNLAKSGSSYEEKYFEHQAKTLLAQYVSLFQGAGKTSGGTIFIPPDGTLQVDRIIYLDKKDFDGVQVWSRYLFTKNEEKDFPVAVNARGKLGSVTIEPETQDCTGFESPNCLIGTESEDDLSLW